MHIDMCYDSLGLAGCWWRGRP